MNNSNWHTAFNFCSVFNGLSLRAELLKIKIDFPNNTKLSLQIIVAMKKNEICYFTVSEKSCSSTRKIQFVIGATLELPSTTQH